MINNYKRIRVTECLLEDGRIVEYDACAATQTAYSPSVFTFIGRGTIYSIDGIVQKSPLFGKLCFFKRA